MSKLELEDLESERDRLDGDRKALLDKLQELQQNTTQEQQQIVAIGGALQTCNYFISKLTPQDSEKESSDADS